MRVINVSSQAHEHAPPIDWDDLQSVKSWTSHGAYGAVKVHTILFTHELARWVSDAGIAAFAVHSGVVDTNFASHGTQALKNYWAPIHHPAAGLDSRR